MSSAPDRVKRTVASATFVTKSAALSPAPWLTLWMLALRLGGSLSTSAASWERSKPARLSSSWYSLIDSASAIVTDFASAISLRTATLAKLGASGVPPKMAPLTSTIWYASTPLGAAIATASFSTLPLMMTVPA